MTLKRLILVLLTVFVLFEVGFSLLASWNAPQITSRLQLYQTDLLLHATEIQPGELSAGEVSAVQKGLLGDDPLKAALEQYQSVRSEAQSNLDQFQAQLARLSPATASSAAPSPDPSADSPGDTADTAIASQQLQQLQLTIQQQQTLIHQLDLRIGIIQAQQGQTAVALNTWTTLVGQLPDPTAAPPDQPGA
ncbi:MAG TPA: hypothetical protein V6C88_01270, partial [Chroococcidiopsis sp.]